MVRTDSINEAAYVVAQGMSHPEYEWVTDKLCLFVFKCDKVKVTNLFDEYKEGGKVEAKVYAGALAHLKNEMFQSKRTT